MPFAWNKITKKNNPAPKFLPVNSSVAHDNIPEILEIPNRKLKIPKTRKNIFTNLEGKSCLIVNSGEVFRQNWNGMSSDVGDTYRAQKLASLSHQRFAKYLSPMNVDFFLNTYECNSTWKNDLLSWINPIKSNFYNIMQPSEEAMHRDTINMLSQMDLSKYSFILFLRADFFIYDYFLEVFNPNETRIVFGHIDSHLGTESFNNGVRYPGICHNILFVPNSRFNMLLEYKIWNKHPSLSILSNYIDLSDIGIYINSLHSCNTVFGWNPIYVMVGRPASRKITHRNIRYNLNSLLEESVDNELIYEKLLEIEDYTDWNYLLDFSQPSRNFLPLLL